MHCLGLGGLELFYDKDLEEELIENYPHNRNRYYYEIRSPGEKPRDPDLMRGKCIKVMGDGCLSMGLDPLKVVFMKRDPLSQYESMRNALGMVQTQYEIVSNRFIRNLEKVDLTVFDYDDVLKDPLGSFQLLADRGWPIDPVKASEGVDVSQKHF